MPKSRPSTALTLLQWQCLLLLTAYTACVFLLWGTLEEDSYIFFRVAENIASGFGYVFNRGGEHVETGSSPIWQGLLALAALTPLPLITTAKVLGAFSAIGCLWHCWKIEKLFGALPVIFSAWLLTTSITFLFWSQSGMETVLFAMLVIVFIRSLLDSEWHNRTGLLALFVCFGRPEGFIYLPAMLVACLAVPSYRRYFLRDAITVVIGLLIFHAVRWRYFDDIFSSAFYAKSAFYPVPHWNLYKTWILNIQLYWLLPLALIALKNPRSFVIIWVLFAGCYFAAGNPDGKILFRLGLPAIAAACLLCAAGIQTLASYGNIYRHLALIAGLGVFLTWASHQLTFSQSVFYKQQANPLMNAAQQFSHNPQQYGKDTWQLMQDPSDIHVCNQLPISLCKKSFSYNDFGATGEWLKHNAFPGMLVAGDQMGEIPWTSGSSIDHMDLFGITDKCIGYANFSDNVPKVQGLVYFNHFLTHFKRGPICSRPQAIEYFFNKQPDVLLMGSIFDQHAPDSFYGMLLRDPRFEKTYTLRYAINIFSRVYLKNSLADFSLPSHVLLLDIAKNKILNCPDDTTMRQHLYTRLGVTEDTPQMMSLLQLCQR
jgi:hypothetical protein